jgi:hypothetical protein
VFDQVLEQRAPISLSEVTATASLMRRYDRKYVASGERVVDLIASLTPDWKVLEIDDRRSPRYLTTYFDDEHLRTYHDHVQGRRPRFKIRTRTYENGSSFVEVKSKNGRGLTDKSRIPRDQPSLARLTDSERAWLETVLPDLDVHSLRPTLIVECRRVTIHSAEHDERVTIDHSMSVELDGRRSPLLEGGTVIETKSTSFRSTLCHVLVDHHAHPVSFSKYCAGLSVIDSSVHPRIRVDAERALRSAQPR